MNKTQSGATRESVYEYVEKEYGSLPEHLWTAFPLYSVFRRVDNKKWYAIIMDIQRSKLGLEGEEYVDIIDVKCSPATREKLTGKPGFLPAYHLNRKNWITVLLDGSVDTKTLFELIDESYVIAKGEKKQAARSKATSWLVPANPKYYDIEKAFEESDAILWKQSSSVIVGDTIYLYLAAPYSCVRYKCRAIEVDIPYDYHDDNVSMQKVMKIERLHTYDKTLFDIGELSKHGIKSVRGPRSIPFSLRCALEKESEHGA
ncbi:MAG: MmcQ/YjbR family DNA-binding protein [Clostridiales bacterium]|nr:MmcQ/YjbR family DNA-binding protein [Clostridiales bacterium]